MLVKSSLNQFLINIKIIILPALCHEDSCIFYRSSWPWLPHHCHFTHINTYVHELVSQSSGTLLRRGQTHTRTAQPADRPAHPLVLLSLLAQYSSSNLKVKPPHSVTVSPAATGDNLIHWYGRRMQVCGRSRGFRRQYELTLGSKIVLPAPLSKRWERENVRVNVIRRGTYSYSSARVEVVSLFHVVIMIIVIYIIIILKKED
jgi:hypothetical protein